MWWDIPWLVLITTMLTSLQLVANGPSYSLDLLLLDLGFQLRVI
jgi:hypothetical protein